MNCKKKIILSRIKFIFIIYCTSISAISFADNNLDTIKNNVENTKQGIDSTNSTIQSSKETTKSVKDFLTTEDDPKGKEFTLKQPQTIPQPIDKPGSIFDRLFGRIIGVQIYSQRDANNNSSILSEIVVIYKPEQYQKIANFRVKDWFTMTADQRTFKNSTDIQVYRFETTPDLPYSEYLLDINSGALAAFLFIRTENSLNTLPIKLNPYKNINIKYFTFGFNTSQYPES